MSNIWYWVFQVKDNTEETIGFFKYLDDAQAIAKDTEEGLIETIRMTKTLEWRKI